MFVVNKVVLLSFTINRINKFLSGAPAHFISRANCINRTNETFNFAARFVFACLF